MRPFWLAARVDTESELGVYMRISTNLRRIMVVEFLHGFQKPPSFSASNAAWNPRGYYLSWYLARACFDGKEHSLNRDRIQRSLWTGASI